MFKTYFFKYTVVIITLLCGSPHVFSQEYDLLLKGGTVIDPKNKIERKTLDIAIKNDTIVAVKTNINTSSAKKTVDLKGYYVSPGIIDLHTHNFYGTKENHYLSDGFLALPPDGFTFRNGVTTVVDAGSPGWKNFETFKLSLIHI